MGLLYYRQIFLFLFFLLPYEPTRSKVQLKKGDKLKPFVFCLDKKGEAEVKYLELQAQFSSVAQSCPTLSNLMNCSTPGLPVHHNSRSSLRLTCIQSVLPSSHLILCHPLCLLPPILPSIRVFSY